MIFGSKFGGYVTVEATGKNSAAFLNDLVAADISLWDISSKEDGVTFSVSLAHLGDLRRVARHRDCEIRLRRRGGLALGIHRLKRHRHGLWTALIVVLLLWCALSLVWKVEVTAEEGTALSAEQRAEILAAAEDCGVHLLRWKPGVDPKETAAAIQQSCPDLAWVGISVQGVTLTIRVAEKMEDTRDLSSYGDVVAKKDGTIRRIFVLRGQKAAEPGDTVKSGDVLISGDIVYEEEGKDPVYDRTAAKGTVFASVRYEGVCRVAMTRQELLPTGNTAGILWLSGPNTHLCLWGEDKDPFSHSVVAEGKVSLFGWQLLTKTYREAEVHNIRISEAEAQALAEEKAGERAKEQMTKDSLLLDRKVEVKTLENGVIEVRVILECEEEIATFTAADKG